MNVLSLFDGISCGQVALNRAGIKYDNYYASEIDKYAIKVTQKNWPKTIQLGDILKWREWNLDWSSIGFIGAGFPCQAWSIAGKQLGDKDDRGKLFWVMLDIIKHVKHCNPNVKFLIENVRMKKEFEDYVTFHTENALGEVNKYLINSSLVSAQSRKRFYWTNIDNIDQPENKNLKLIDVLIDKVDEKYFLSERIVSGFLNKASVFGDRFLPLTANDPYIFDKPKRLGNLNNGGQGDRVYDINYKSVTLSAVGGGRGAKTGLYLIPFTYSSSGRSGKVDHRTKKLAEKALTLTTNTGFNPKSFTGVETIIGIRRLTPIECERLQTLPDNYTDGLSDTQRYKCIGNGWTVDVIAHILKSMK